MAKVLVVCHSRSGNTQKMAEAVVEGASEVSGADVVLKKVADATLDDLLKSDAIVLGSPVYYGTMAAELKKLIDDSVKFHGKLDGKVGGAFASAGVMGGGLETTVTDILHALLVHGMIVKGTFSGAHYGPVSVGAPDDKAKKDCRRLGKTVAELAVKLWG
jgi:NAD(P)H dehydrogenase (quinone)